MTDKMLLLFDEELAKCPDESLINLIMHAGTDALISSVVALSINADTKMHISTDIWFFGVKISIENAGRSV